MAPLFLAAILGFVAACTAADTLQYSTSFEQGQEQGWNGRSRIPTAAVSFSCPACARTGTNGILVTINASSTAGWHVQVGTPTFNFSLASLYTACFWIRAAAPLAWKNDIVPMYLDYWRPDGSVAVALAANVQVTTSWRQVCLEDFAPPRDMPGYYALDMGTVNGTLHIDDFTLTSRPNTTTASSPAPPAGATANGTLYTTSFEQGQEDGWNGRSRIATASVSFSCPACARTGTNGILVAINVSSIAGWHVQVGTPTFNFSTAYLYTACFWVRSPAQLAWNNDVIPLYLDYWRPDGSVAVSLAINFRVTTSWRHVCLEDFAPPRDMPGYYALDMGTINGTLHIDDFTLTARPNTTAADAAYASPASVAARIEAHRKGNFSLRFLNSSTGAPLTGSLASLALRLDQHDFPFGSAFEWDSVPLARQGWYFEAVKKHFNTMVPEWSLKWPVYEPAMGNYTARYQSLLQKHFNFSASNDFVRNHGHTLEWLSYSPYEADHWSRQGGCDNYRTYLRDRITRDVKLFKGKFQSYDVFNEILHARQFVEACPGMFPAILYDAHRWAAEADPGALLCLNEPGLIDSHEYWRDLIQLVRDMRDAGAPLHCLGIQAYLSTDDLPSPAFMKPRLDKLAALNLTLFISEFNFYSFWDFNSYQGPVWNGTEDEHAALYDTYVRFWFSLPYINGMVMWNFWDSSNWIQNGGIYHANTTAKASARKLLQLWGSEWNTTISASDVSLADGGLYGPYRGFNGKYRYDVAVGGVSDSGTLRFPMKGGAAQEVTVLVG